VRQASLLHACRLAGRELRGGARGLGVFVGCLVLGVAAVAAVGSLAASVKAGIAKDARALLGGDVEARLALRPADDAEQRYLAEHGRLSRVTTMRGMARRGDGSRHSLVELKAVDARYPLYGTVGLSPPANLTAALAPRDGVFGAAVDPTILDRLGVKIGDEIRIGGASLRIAATIAREPDAATGALSFGPRVLVADAALKATGLVRPGALVTYAYRLRLRPGIDPARFAEEARAAFPQAGWRVRGFADASPFLKRLLDRVTLFLSLVALTTLLVGGVGIGNAVAGYIAGKTETIAILKSLGAPSRLIFTAYLLAILAFAAAGIAGGLVLGAVLPSAVQPLLSRFLPAAPRLGIYPAPLLVAAAFGLLTVLVFSLMPLAAIGRVGAGALFRDRRAPMRRSVPVAALAVTGLLALALAALAVVSAPDHRIALWFVAGIAAAFGLFAAAGAGVAAIARAAGRPRRPSLRLALANLYRPGAATLRIMLSLGIGLGVFVVIALIEGNLAAEIEGRLPAEAPGYFFIDIQQDELAGFAAIVRGTPGATMDEVPMMRGRITRLNGVPVEEAKIAHEARWAVNSDRGLTYSSAMPKGSALAAGSWWPADYRGPPLVSFDAALARGMGLRVGDTLTVNLMGREITARIANLRHIDWERLGINFAIVFAPGTLEAAPQTHLATVTLPQSEEEGLLRRVLERFPNVSAIHVREALAAVDRVVRMVGTAVRLTALATLGAGIMVLGGAIAAGHRRRVYDAVVLKVLGATRGVVARVFLIEHGLLGGLAALAAGLVGTLAAWGTVTRLMRLDWVFLPGPVLATLAVGALVALGFGFAGTWAALGAMPAPYLRNE
jgi:putative ABC transport system permease protein